MSNILRESPGRLPTVLKAYSAVWFCRHPLRPPVFERQEGKCDSNAFYCTERSFSVMVRIFRIHVNWFLVVAEHLETSRRWLSRQCERSRGRQVNGSECSTGILPADAECVLHKPRGSGRACALRYNWTHLSFADVVCVWLFPTAASSGLTATLYYR